MSGCRDQVAGAGLAAAAAELNIRGIVERLPGPQMAHAVLFRTRAAAHRYDRPAVGPYEDTEYPWPSLVGE